MLQERALALQKQEEKLGMMMAQLQLDKAREVGKHLNDSSSKKEACMYYDQCMSLKKFYLKISLLLEDRITNYVLFAIILYHIS